MLFLPAFGEVVVRMEKRAGVISLLVSLELLHGQTLVFSAVGEQECPREKSWAGTILAHISYTLQSGLTDCAVQHTLPDSALCPGEEGERERKKEKQKDILEHQ